MAAADAEQPTDDAAEGEQAQSPLGSKDDAATIWHANEAAESEDGDVQSAAADEDTSEPTAAGMPVGDSAERANGMQADTANRAQHSDWQQVAHAARHDDTASPTAGGRGSIGADRAAVHSGSSGITFEDGQQDGKQADGGPASEPATAWQGQAREGGMHNTMTEPLVTLTDSGVLAEAEEVAESARQYNPAAAVLGGEQPTRADASEAALPLQVRPVVSAVSPQDFQSIHSAPAGHTNVGCCRAFAAAIQEHIGAVLTRVRSLMSDVSTFKSKRATADALSSAGQPDGSVQLSNGSASGRQLIGTSLSDYQDGVAARVLPQQWQARQQDTKGSELPKAFTPMQASAAFGRLAVQTTS